MAASFRLIAWVLACASFAQLAALDVSAEATPVWFIVSAVGLFWASPLTVLAGVRTKHGFKAFQPFVGSEWFVNMQAFGWTCYGLFSASCVLLLLNPSTLKNSGAAAACGGFGFAAHALLNLSLDRFVKNEVLVERNRLSVWTIAGGIAGALLLGLDRRVEGTVAVFITQWLLYVLSGNRTLGFKFWRLQQGSPRYVLLQGFSWSVFGVFLDLCYTTTTTTPPTTSSQQLTGFGSTLGLMGVTANILQWVSFDLFAELETRVDAAAAVAAPPTPVRKKIEHQRVLEFKKNLATNPLYVSSLMALVYNAASILLTEKDEFRVVLITILGTPAAQLSGLYLKTFNLIQPMAGGTFFVICQGVAWTLFAVFLTSWSVFNVVPVRAGLVAHALVLASLHSYVSSTEEKLNNEKIGFARIQALKEFASDNVGADVVTLFIGLFLRLGAYVLNARDHIAIPSSLYRLSLAALAFSVALKHLRGISEIDVHFYAPFQGPPQYIILQSLGWTVFGVALCVDLFVAFGEAWRTEFFSAMVTTSAFVLGFVALASSYAKYSAAAAASDADESPEDRALKIELNELLSKASNPLIKSYLLRALADRDELSENQGSTREKVLRGMALGVGGSLTAVSAHVQIALFALHTSEPALLGAGLNALTTSFVVLLVCPLGFGDAFSVRRMLVASKELTNTGGLPFEILLAAGFVLSASAQFVTFFLREQFLWRVLIAVMAYTATVLQLAALAWFDRKAKSRVLVSYLGDARVGAVMGLVGLLCASAVDVGLMRFGMSAQAVQPLGALAWLLVAGSVPATYWLDSSTTTEESSVATLIQVVGIAAWSFALLLGLSVLGAGSVELTTPGVLISVMAQFVTSLNLTDPQTIYNVSLVAFGLMFAYLLLPGLRAFLDVPMWWYARIFKEFPHALSPDGKHPMEGCSIKRDVKYTSPPRARYEFDIVSPVEQTQTHPVVFAHGGGHIVLQREILLHSITPLARRGFVVYAVEYPLAPENRYPKSVVAVMKALQFIRSHHCNNQCLTDASKPGLNCGYCDLAESSQNECRCCPHERGCDTVHLMGDSAGGGIMSMVAAMVCNRSLLDECRSSFPNVFQKTPIISNSLPRIDKLVLLYGLVGREANWKVERSATFAGRLFELISKLGVEFVLNLYTSNHHTEVLTDVPPTKLESYANRTLMICGKSDPLVNTNFHAEEVLLKAGHDVSMELFPGTHAFHGVPVQWTLNSWMENALPATRSVCDFLAGSKQNTDEEFEEIKKSLRESAPVDWSPLVVFGGGAAIFAAFARCVFVVMKGGA